MSSQQKFFSLIAGIIVSIFICYKLAFCKTFAIQKQHKQLKQQELLFKNTPKKLSKLQHKQVYFDSILTKYQLNGNSIQISLLEYLNNFSKNNNLKVINFTKPHISTNNQLITKTYQFTLQGEYNDIIMLIYQLEQKTKFGEIISLQFNKHKNYRTGRNYLQAKVLLKSLN